MLTICFSIYRPNGTLEELGKATAFLQEYIHSIPGVQMTVVPTQYPSLYAWYEANKNRAPVGYNTAVGNRLLDGKLCRSQRKG